MSEAKCPCGQCRDHANPIHQRLRRLATYVEPERRSFFAAQLDQLALLGSRQDDLLSEILELPKSAIAEKHAEEWAWAAENERRLLALGADPQTQELLLDHWRRRLSWKTELVGSASGRHILRLRVRDRILDLVCPATLESYLLIFEVFITEPYGHLPSVPLIYDFGAHIGSAALYFGAHFPDAKIICVEPVLENIGFLEENVKRNGINAEIHPVAVGKTSGTQTLRVCPEAGSLSSIFPIDDLTGAPPGQLTTHSIQVECRTFSELIIDRDAGLKLDLEGAEHLLVDTPELTEGIRWVAGELHLGPGIIAHDRRWDLVTLLRRNFLLEMDGPGVFGDTVTHTFRGHRIKRFGAKRS